MYTTGHEIEGHAKVEGSFCLQSKSITHTQRISNDLNYKTPL